MRNLMMREYIHIYVTDRETLRIFLVNISSNKFIFDTKYENETMHPNIHLFLVNGML